MCGGSARRLASSSSGSRSAWFPVSWPQMTRHPRRHVRGGGGGGRMMRACASQTTPIRTTCARATTQRPSWGRCARTTRRRISSCCLEVFTHTAACRALVVFTHTAAACCAAVHAQTAVVAQAQPARATTKVCQSEMKKYRGPSADPGRCRLCHGVGSW